MNRRKYWKIRTFLNNEMFVLNYLGALSLFDFLPRLERERKDAGEETFYKKPFDQSQQNSEPSSVPPLKNQAEIWGRLPHGLPHRYLRATLPWG